MMGCMEYRYHTLQCLVHIPSRFVQIKNSINLLRELIAQHLIDFERKYHKKFVRSFVVWGHFYGIRTRSLSQWHGYLVIYDTNSSRAFFLDAIFQLYLPSPKWMKGQNMNKKKKKRNSVEIGKIATVDRFKQVMCWTRNDTKYIKIARDDVVGGGGGGVAIRVFSLVFLFSFFWFPQAKENMCTLFRHLPFP